MNIEIIDRNSEAFKLLSTCPLKIIDKMEILQFKANDFYLEQEKYHKNVYIVVEGEFEIFLEGYSEKRVILAYYNKVGCFIGEQEAILNKPYSSSVKNTTDCILISISNVDFLEWVKLDSFFSHKLLYNQCDQIYHLSKQASFYTLHSIKEQVANFILRNKKIRKKEIHHNILASNRHINRILSELENQKIISIELGIIKILDYNKLNFYGEE